MSNVLIGIIGVILFIGLALAGDTEVLLHDEDPAAVRTACARGAGRHWDGAQSAAHVVLAVPPRAVATELVRLQRLGVGETFSHVSSVQAPVKIDAPVNRP